MWTARYNNKIIATLYNPQRRSLRNIMMYLILPFISSGLVFSLIYSSNNSSSNNNNNIIIFFCCGAATQRGSWPPHS